MMHIKSGKHLSKLTEIQTIPDADVFYIPLKSYQTVLSPLVKVGDEVLENQMLAEDDKHFAAPVHSPVSGKVLSIEEIEGTGKCIVIENDFSKRAVSATDQNFSEDVQDWPELLYNAGISGSGGAQFPTHIKYKTGGKSIETFILNGAECEPYLTADYALMRTQAYVLVKAAVLLNKMFNASKIVIAIERQNKELKSVFKEYIRDYADLIKIKLLPNTYPQGGELQLIKSVTKKELPKGAIPINYGIVVSNVATVWAAYHALVNKQPLVERIITVAGENKRHIGNFRVKIGTPVGHIKQFIDAENILSDMQMVLGGPMMGKRTDFDETPIEKGTGGFLNFKDRSDHKENCIQCGYCVDVCPQRLMPMEFVRYQHQNDIAQLKAHALTDCIECGACEYICPSNLPLLQSIKDGKQALYGAI